MDTKWKDMSTKEKVLNVLIAIAAVASFVFAMTHLLNWLAIGESLWQFSFGAMCILDSVKTWKKKRQSAIIGLVCGIILLATGTVNVVV